MRREAIGLPVSLDVEGRTAVVVGGGAEAEDKVGRLLDGGAAVVVVTQGGEIGAGLSALAAAGRIAMFPRAFASGDLNDADLVLVCERDAALAASVFEAAQAKGVAAWSCDDPAHSHLAMPALARLGRARIAVSTGGAAPALSGRIREALERDLGARFAAFVERLFAERVRLLAEEPDEAERRRRLRALVDGFELRIEARYPDD